VNGWPAQESRFGRRGMVATVNQLASQAGLRILRAGGNAVDAAVAAGAVLTVVEPALGQLGGDLFLLVYSAETGAVVALNGSGAAPLGASREDYVALGGIPEHGLLAATIPGLVDAWEVAASRFGTLPLGTLLAEAIDLAQAGVRISHRTGRGFANQADVIQRFPTTRRIFAPEGTPLGPGDLLVQRDLANTLTAIAREGAATFYQGEVAQRMLRFAAEEGAPLAARDLAEHRTLQLEPVSTRYRGVTVFEQPPVSHGLVVLLALNTLEQFDLAAFGAGSAEAVHLQVEAHKLAIADRLAYLGDPRFVRVPLGELLSKEHAQRQAKRIEERYAQPVLAPAVEFSDTSYLCVVDGAGNVVSYIHSLMGNLGCGQVLGDTGVIFNNRMRGFTLDPENPNVLAPGKRPVHSLNSYLVLQDGRPRLVGGTPGLYWQVQTNLQMLCNVVDFAMDLQTAVDAPRWLMGPATLLEQTELTLEDRFRAATIEGLRAKGHRVEVGGAWTAGGSVQAIHIDSAKQLLEGATDPRPGTGTVLSW
jgi:gamma-glutamyltranspeptidase/glutathione hydrolase